MVSERPRSSSAQGADRFWVMSVALSTGESARRAIDLDPEAQASVLGADDELQ